eukprot:3225500-Prymnesium_polylepis.2
MRPKPSIGGRASLTVGRASRRSRRLGSSSSVVSAVHESSSRSDSERNESDRSSVARAREPSASPAALPPIDDGAEPAKGAPPRSWSSSSVTQSSGRAAPFARSRW